MSARAKVKPTCSTGNVMDYGFFLREPIAADADWSGTQEFDLFISAFNLSDRVRHVYDNVRARRKVWLIHREYGLLSDQLPPEPYFATTAPGVELLPGVRREDEGRTAGLSEPNNLHRLYGHASPTSAVSAEANADGGLSSVQPDLRGAG
jgi:hypothetical protein